MTSITTHDGTVLLFDPEIGVVSATSREEAEVEIRRRKAAKRDRERSAA
jgi:hypothetical protein